MTFYRVRFLFLISLKDDFKRGESQTELLGRGTNAKPSTMYYLYLMLPNVNDYVDATGKKSIYIIRVPARHFFDVPDPRSNY